MASLDEKLIQIIGQNVEQMYQYLQGFQTGIL